MPRNRWKREGGVHELESESSGSERTVCSAKQCHEPADRGSSSRGPAAARPCWYATMDSDETPSVPSSSRTLVRRRSYIARMISRVATPSCLAASVGERTDRASEVVTQNLSRRVQAELIVQHSDHRRDLVSEAEGQLRRMELFLGLSYFPVWNRGGTLCTTGCSGTRKQGTFSWPLWSGPLSPRVVRSLLRDASLARQGDELRALRGVTHVVQAPIRRNDQGGYGSFGAVEPVVVRRWQSRSRGSSALRS